MHSLPDEFTFELRGKIKGEIRTDQVTRLLYSTDASIYQIKPFGVVFPRTTEDISAVLEVASKYNIPVLPRGSGSSLAGQAIGPAVILDCSRYLNRLIEINPEDKTALVEPGLILASLNQAVVKHRLQFGPDPASAERATIGGCIGNNATGAHSIVYGMTADHIIGVDLILADGSQTSLEEVTLQYARQMADQDNSTSSKKLEKNIYQAALSIRETYSVEIQKQWPITWRRVSGYNLNYLLPWSSSQPPLWDSEWGNYPPVSADAINLAQLLAGSEGTLAVLSRAKLRLVQLPRYTVLGVLRYPNIATACDAVPLLLECNPTAIELIPQSLIRLAKSVPAYAKQLDFVQGDPAALLVVEFSGDDPDILGKQVKNLPYTYSGQPAPLLAETEAQQKQVWAVRKVGLGILNSRPGNIKPIAFIEDMAVPVENLGTFVREIDRICADYGVEADYYAHASAGCLHIRPMIDLKSAEGRRNLRNIAEASVQLTLKLGGATSAEHGDGLARSEWLEKAYGNEIAGAFRAIKNAFDPQRLMNPGKIIDPLPMDTQLRYGDDYDIRGWSPFLDFSRQGGYPGAGGLAGSVEQCNGAGVCRKSDGIMCPSFQASSEEMHSTRGRANLLRALLSGKFSSKQVGEKAVWQALDLCLACKGCKAECPSSVDMAKLKYEYQHHYYSTRAGRRPLRDYLFGYIGTFARLGQPFSRITNMILRAPLTIRLIEHGMGISRQRTIPKMSRHTLRARTYHEADPSKECCLFLSDAFTEYFYPEIGQDAINVLAHAQVGCKYIPVIGAGRTLISKGFLDAAQKHAMKLVNAITTLDPEGKLPIIGIEPSEILTLRDEYLDLLPQDNRVKEIAQRAFMIDEFLTREYKDGAARIDLLKTLSVIKDHPSRILLHGHCYQRAQPPASDGFPVGVEATIAVLEAVGYQVSVAPDGCCGMAGAFGYEVEHYDLSIKIGEMGLFPAVRSANDALISASGISCRSQIMDGSGKNAYHPITLLHRALTQS